MFLKRVSWIMDAGCLRFDSGLKKGRKYSSPTDFAFHFIHQSKSQCFRFGLASRIQNLSSSFQNPESIIQLPESRIYHPASSIQNPASIFLIFPSYSTEVNKIYYFYN